MSIFHRFGKAKPMRTKLIPVAALGALLAVANACSGSALPTAPQQARTTNGGMAGGGLAPRLDENGGMAGSGGYTAPPPNGGMAGSGG
jgi:hypothetical protein